MASPSGSPWTGLRAFLAAQTPADVSDRELLERFLAGHDETAFAALVHRHGAMVHNVCRRRLRSSDDAEDACQVVFLILARKAASIRKRESLGSWLHGVAVRVARDLQARRARQAARPLQAGDDVARPAQAEALTWDEVREALDEELQRLPEHYRAALVLCYLEGRSRDEAAVQLGWSLATLHGRLERGRALLRSRLVRRGLTLSAALFADALVHDSVAGTLPARLVLEILRTATGTPTGTPAGPPAQVAALVNGALSPMIRLNKKSFLTLALLALLGAGGYAVYRFARAEAPPQAWSAALTPEEVRTEETIELSGQVLDPAGRPVAGAELYLVALYDSPMNHGPPLARSGPDGRFTLPAPKSELAQHLAVARPVDIVAVAPGFGMAWRPAADFLPHQEQQKAGIFSRLSAVLSGSKPVLKLARSDTPLKGRVEDADGRPVAGATVRLERVFAADAADLGPWKAAVTGNPDFGESSKHLPHQLGGDGLGRFKATTDKEGRFRLAGIGAGRLASLRLDGPGLAAATIVARTEAGERLDLNMGGWFGPDAHGCFGSDFTLSVARARPIVGVVRDLDTGRPVPGALVQSHRFAGNRMTGLADLRVRADAQGRYRLDGMPIGKGNALLARGPDDEPYLPVVAEIDTSSGTGPARLDMKIKRGLWAEGKVTDAETGRPLSATVEYYCLMDNHHGTDIPGFTGAFLGPNGYHTDAAGRYRVPVLPGRGIVAAVLHGQRSWGPFSKVSSTQQAGKGYTEYRGRFDPPDGPAAQSGWFVLAQPQHFLVQNYHQMAVIKPAEKVRSITCDLPVHADGSPCEPGRRKEKD